MVKAVKDSVVLDNWGIGVSILCSIHCALMPILIVTSAIVGWQAETLEEIELPLFIAAAIIGSLQWALPAAVAWQCGFCFLSWSKYFSVVC